MMESNGEVRQSNFYNPLTNRNEVQNVLVPTDRGSTLSPPERANLSSNLIASLGFSKLLRWNPAQYNELLSTADRERIMSNQQRQDYRSGDYGVDGDGDDQDDDDRFDRPGRPREDTQHDDETGRSRSERDFDRDERETFATNSGFYYDQEGNIRGQNTYLGEEAPQLEDGEGYEALAGDASEALLGQQPFQEPSEGEVGSIRRRYRQAKREVATERKREALGSQASSTTGSQTTFQPPSVHSSLFSRYDPDTQGFNVGYAFQDSTPRGSVAPRVPPAPRRQPSDARSAPRVAPPPTARAVVASPAKKGKKAQAPTPTLNPIALPKKMSEVPSDMGTLLRIANSAGIRVNKKADGTYGKASNIRRNIILRLGLAGKR
jgi:hypothetical protein